MTVSVIFMASRKKITRIVFSWLDSSNLISLEQVEFLGIVETTTSFLLRFPRYQILLYYKDKPQNALLQSFSLWEGIDLTWIMNRTVKTSFSVSNIYSARNLIISQLKSQCRWCTHWSLGRNDTNSKSRSIGWKIHKKWCKVSNNSTFIMGVRKKRT